jgi:putative FmdB family regulatory protein
MPLYDVRCEQGHQHEVLRHWTEADAVACPDCGGPAQRTYNYRVAIGQPATDTRGLFRRFTEASSEIDYAATTAEQNTGQALQTPNIWRHAKAKAAAMVAAGEAPPPRPF